MYLILDEVKHEAEPEPPAFTEGVCLLGWACCRNYLDTPPTPAVNVTIPLAPQILIQVRGSMRDISEEDKLTEKWISANMLAKVLEVRRRYIQPDDFSWGCNRYMTGMLSFSLVGFLPYVPVAQ